MRTKLFFAFTLIISLAILSNLVFERLIIGDFNDFVRGTEEDHIYGIMASVEGSFREDQWDMRLLTGTLEWGLMIGLETYVEDIHGNRIISSAEVLSRLNPNTMKRINSLFKLPSGKGEFTWYPLYVGGIEIGRLYLRPLERVGLIPLKEEIFKKRGREFLVISFLIAGAGALILAVLFTIFLSNPVRRLTAAAEGIARGDFSVYAPTVKRKYKDEIDRLTEAFNYMAEALRREDALRRHLTSNIAHELRTPLTIIKGNLEAIDDGIISDPHKAIKSINQEIERIISLVEGIEDITSAEASFFKKGDMAEIDLMEFVESVAEGMRKIIDEKGLFLRVQGAHMSVRTYPEKLHIILKNLLTNAYKFTDRGGITVSCGEHNSGGASGFFIAIEDTGRGITEEKLSRIFDRFYKDIDSGGRGLGLAIVKELTEVISGKIKVESVHGKGSKFTLLF